MSSLYRTETIKNSHYSPNGEGRDSYIYVNNGGVERNTYPYQFKETSRITKRSYSPGSPRLDPKALKYKSDGTGRDTYIGSNNGGLSSSYNSNGFYSSLRQPMPVTTRSDFSGTQTLWLHRRKLEESRYQKELTRRLSVPKAVRSV